ncbi:metallophosphoesterase [Paenibacillus cellulosilyticus]|uniref:metallophosphoesterase n=1 Tax=Paenibacillus cellulosilyticus TaxID=375489 RepID=UPI00157FCDB0|nr:metallophosphoesterase [Paenibacillus cellulosilyticus]QKS43886.1 metallophosphoesterase [Paenibacillus cellulosilyticus]
MRNRLQRGKERLTRMTAGLLAMQSLLFGLGAPVAAGASAAAPTAAGLNVLGAPADTAVHPEAQRDRYATVKRSDGYNLVFPVMSDIHIGSGDKAETKFASALEQLNRLAPHYDAIASVGDLTDHGKAEQYDTFMAIYNRYKQPAARSLLTIGNHDYYGSSGAMKGQRLFLEKTEMPGIYYDRWINGYHFIVLGSENKSTGGKLSDEQLKWLKEKLAEHASADKPIFVLFHQHISDTVYGSDRWGHTQNHKKLYAILSKYPQVITFSGHSHYMLESPRTIHQRDFTSLGTSSIRYPELEPGMVQGNHPSDDISQGYLVMVKDDRVIVKRRDFHRNDWTGEDWVIDYPASKTAFRYTDDRDRINPSFEPSAQATVEPSSVHAARALLRFDQAKDNLFVHAYDIEVKREGGQRNVLKLHAFSEFYKHPMPAELTVELNGLTPNTAYTASVYAVDAFGNRSDKPLAAGFRTSALTPLQASLRLKIRSWFKDGV